MRIKGDFVTNSSSTAFIISNDSNLFLTLVDFVKENPELVANFSKYYGYTDDPNFTQENMIESAKENNIDFDPKSEQLCVFGDESGTIVGQVFDYMLRDGGSSEHFSWWFDHYER
jgi:hypothetical protein